MYSHYRDCPTKYILAFGINEGVLLTIRRRGRTRAISTTTSRCPRRETFRRGLPPRSGASCSPWTPDGELEIGSWGSGILKAFTLRLPGGPELTIDVDAVHGPADSGDLTDLSGLFVELGEVARDHSTGVLITVDELHYVRLEVLEALVMGLHRANQLALPITVAAAGLPYLATLTGEAKSYAERMFTFPEIGSLAEEQAREALQVPAHDEGVAWDPDALIRVVEATQGYPYFLQEFGKQAWEIADGGLTDHVRGGGTMRSGRSGRTR